MNQYSMIVQWSNEDQLFLVTIPEFADRVVMPCTRGETRTQAIRKGEEVIEMYLKAWQVESEPIPEPSELLSEQSVCDSIEVVGSEFGECWITLRFFGDRLDPDYITEIFGVQPTRSCRRGDIFRGKVRDRIETIGKWHYKIDWREGGTNLEGKVNELLDRFPENLNVWHELATNFKADLHCSLWFEESACWIGFSWETMKRIADRKLAISSNIYFEPDNDGDQS